MNDICWVCKVAPATEDFNVGLTKTTQGPAVKYFQQANAPVPVCSACKQKELAAMRGNAKAALGSMTALVLLGAAFGGWAGAGTGFAIGFFVMLFVGAMKKPTVMGEHPNVMAYKAQGYRVTYPD